MPSRAVSAVLPLPLLAVLSCAERQPEPMTLRFSAIPDQKVSEQAIKYERVARYLSERLGVPVEFQPTLSYRLSVEAFKNGDIDFAWFGGLTGVDARALVPGAEAVVCGAADAEFRSYFIAHEDAGIEPSEDFPASMRGRDFLFGDQKSTSGRLMPEHYVRTLGGAPPEEFFGSIAFSGSHPNTLRAVNEGRTPLGVVNYLTFENAAPEDRARVRVIWRTPSYYDYNLTVRGDLDARFGAGLRERLIDAFLRMDDPSLLAAFGRERFVRCRNEDFDAIRRIAIDCGLTAAK